jgi:hypothetical protein
MSRKPARSRAQSGKRRSTRSSKAPARVRAKPAAHTPLDKLVDAAALALRLPLDPQWRPAVAANLEVILRLAAVVDEFGLPDEAEPAPVFKTL